MVFCFIICKSKGCCAIWYSSLFCIVENASGAERNRVGQILWLLQKALPPNMYSFARTKEYQKGRRCPQGMKAPVGLSRRRPVCAANAVCSTQQGLRYFRGAGGGGLRLPASASCLGRHSHPAGRCPNSSRANAAAIPNRCCSVYTSHPPCARMKPTNQRR